MVTSTHCDLDRKIILLCVHPQRVIVSGKRGLLETTMCGSLASAETELILTTLGHVVRT